MDKVGQIKDILGMHSDIESVVITPDRARKLIAFNTNNRKLSDRVVDKYAKCMLDGNWHADVSMITFSSTGELTNGQHRINAIIKSNTPVKFVVSLNVDNFFEMDRGKSRTIIDNIMLDEKFKDTEVAKTKEIPSIVSVLYRAITGKAVTSGEGVAKILEKYADDLILLRDEGILLGVKRTNKKQVSGAMLVAYANGVSLEDLRHIRSVIDSGMCTCAQDAPIIALRDILLRTKGSGIGVDKELYRCTLYCIDAYQRGLIRKVCKAADPKYTLTWD